MASLGVQIVEPKREALHKARTRWELDTARLEEERAKLEAMQAHLEKVRRATEKTRKIWEAAVRTLSGSLGSSQCCL